MSEGESVQRSESPVTKIEKEDHIEEKMNALMELTCRCFLVFIIGYVASLIPSIKLLISQFHELGLNSNWEDLVWIIPGFLHSYFAYILCTKVLSKYLRPFYRENKFRPYESDSSRLWRYGNLLYGCYYYILSFAVLMWLVIGTEYCPKAYGGDLDLGNTIRIWPYEAPKSIRIFYMLTFGHHFERTVKEINHRNQKTFWTLFFHHLLTLVLLGLSFVMKHYQYGVTILLIHDMTDIWLNLSRFFREFIEPFATMAKACFVVCVFAWFHSRIWMFTKEVFIDGFLYSVMRIPPIIRSFLTAHMFYLVALFFLLILNVYWFMQMLRVIIILFINKKDNLPFEDASKRK